jgi:DNA-binding MarR family transcriptional regulator
MNDATSNPHSHILDISESWKRERPDLDLTHFLLAVQVMRLGRVVDESYDAMCRKRYGISGADMRVLFALRRAGKPYTRRATDLFRALLVTSGAITKQVDRLSKLGFVQRIDELERRAGIQLTTKGLRIANAATDVLATHSPIAPGLASMSKAEVAAGRQFVEKAILGLEADAPSKGGLSAAPKKRRPKTDAPQ